MTTGHSLCGTTSHTENVQMRLVGPLNMCAAERHMAIGDFPATDAERLCFGTVRGADPVQRSPFGGEQSECQQRSPPPPGTADSRYHECF